MTKWQARDPSKLRSALCIILPVLIVVVLLSSYILPVQAFWQNILRAVGLKPFAETVSAEGLLIHVIDVGKADAILIESEDAVLMVDTGTVNSADDILQYLEGRRITNLDALVISHGDSDHIGGAETLLKYVSTDHILCSPYSSVSNTFSDAEFLHTGDSLVFGDIILEILGPSTAFESENDNSLVFRLRYGSFSMLFCGDIEKAAEEQLLLSGQDLRADVLKIPHHGSASSTSTAFLEAVSPKLAVISVGEDRNLLPRNSVLKRLNDFGVQYFRTDEQGSVVFSVNRKDIYIITERD